MIYESYSREDTFQLGASFGRVAKSGEIYCLSGDLAAGKTIFAKGFGNGLGVAEDISSPTFTIINIHNGRIPFFHFDVYRIGSDIEMEDTGYEDYFFGDGVCLIEWAELIERLIPKTAVWFSIERDMDKDADYRRISMVSL